MPSKETKKKPAATKPSAKKPADNKAPKKAAPKAAAKKAAPPPAKKTKSASGAAKPAAKKPAAKGGKKKEKEARPVEPKEKKPRLNQQQRIRLLIQRPPKSFRIGQDLPPKGRDLTRFVKWPRYIRLQRQRRILLKRLKMPPPLNQFNLTLDKGAAKNLFKLLNKYRPEEKQAKKRRRLEAAAKIAAAQKQDKAANKRGKVREALAALSGKKPVVLKCGLNHVTSLVERGKAQLVAIAHDVDPIELVVWLPALCRKKKVPYCIVKGKARLGKLVHQKNATCVALTAVRKEDRAELDTLVEVVKSQFNDNAQILRQWSEQKFGIKHRQAEAKHLRRVLKSEAGKAAVLAAEAAAPAAQTAAVAEKPAA